MATIENFEGYIFIIDTTEYSGNFERELTAWCTGQIGECGAGGEEAAAFEKEVDPNLLKYFEDSVVQWPDDHGCCRPATIQPTPGFWNDGMGDHWADDMWGSEEVLAKWEAKKKERGYSHIGDISRCPAYQSVGILFDKMPSQEILDSMMQRSLSFRWGYPKNKALEILGYRVIQTWTESACRWTGPVPSS